MTRYTVNVGINYRPTKDAEEVRAEPGDVVDEVPEKIAKLWVAEGVLEPAAG